MQSYKLGRKGYKSAVHRSVMADGKPPHIVVQMNLRMVLGRREQLVLFLIAANEGLTTTNMIKLQNKEKIYNMSYEKKFGLNAAYLELQKKGLLFGKNKGGRAKYWYVTALGLQILKKIEEGQFKSYEMYGDALVDADEMNLAPPPIVDLNDEMYLDISLEEELDISL